MQNYSAEERSYLWLDAFPLPTREKNALIEKAGSAVRLVKNCAEILEKTVKEKKSGVYNDMVESLKNDVFYKTLTEEYESRRIAAIPRISDGFFKEWKEAEDPPLVQYEKGNASLKKRDGFAVVGSRRTPPERRRRSGESGRGSKRRLYRCPRGRLFFDRKRTLRFQKQSVRNGTRVFRARAEIFL